MAIKEALGGTNKAFDPNGLTQILLLTLRIHKMQVWDVPDHFSTFRNEQLLTYLKKETTANSLKT